MRRDDLYIAFYNRLADMHGGQFTLRQLAASGDVLRAIAAKSGYHGSCLKPHDAGMLYRFFGTAIGTVTADSVFKR